MSNSKRFFGKYLRSSKDKIVLVSSEKLCTIAQEFDQKLKKFEIRAHMKFW